jgi:hypothetical protein
MEIRRKTMMHELSVNANSGADASEFIQLFNTFRRTIASDVPGFRTALRVAFQAAL